MSWLKSIAQEIFGLFVDDGSFAIAVLFWLAVVILVLPRFAPGARWEGPTFFVGLAVILVESVLRFSRRRTK